MRLLPVAPRSMGEEAGHGSGCSVLAGDLSPEKSAEIKSVQCSVSPPEPGYPH